MVFPLPTGAYTRLIAPGHSSSMWIAAERYFSVDIYLLSLLDFVKRRRAHNHGISYAPIYETVYNTPVFLTYYYTYKL